MRIVHISDSHLGFSAYSKSDPELGINQREADFYSAFAQAIDKAIELAPDIVVHAGDMFDKAQPHNRAISFALRQMIRLSHSGIPTLLISGNHSTPRLRETGSIFNIFEHLEGIHPVHDPGVARIVLGDVTVHAMPHSVDPPMSDALKGMAPSTETRYNVAVLHAGIMGSNTYKMDDLNEQSIAMEDFPEGLDYIALGHYHRFSKVKTGMYYSGSTERLGFGELGQSKGLVEVDLDNGSVEFHELTVRDMLELEPVDAHDLTATDIARTIKSTLEENPVDGKIVRLHVNRVRPETARSLDISSIRKMGSEALFFDLKIERTDGGGQAVVEDTSIGALAQEYRRYVTGLEMVAEKKERILNRGVGYFAEDDG